MKRTISILQLRLLLTIIVLLSPQMMYGSLIEKSLRLMRRVSVFMRVELLMIRGVSAVIRSNNFSELVMRWLSYLMISPRL